MKFAKIAIYLCLLIAFGCGNKDTAGAHNDPAPREPQRPGEQPDLPPGQPPAPPKRVATPILMSPIDVFGAQKLLSDPFENFPQSKFVSETARTPVGVSEYDPQLVKKLSGKWFGYWKSKNSFTRKGPVLADLENHRVYIQFNPDMTWDALWLSKFEPGHSSYASMSGKYSFKFPKMILHIEALKVEQRWSSNDGDLCDLKLVCDTCAWQEGNDLDIDLKFEAEDQMIFFDAGSSKNGYSERVYLVKK